MQGIRKIINRLIIKNQHNKLIYWTLSNHFSLYSKLKNNKKLLKLKKSLKRKNIKNL